MFFIIFSLFSKHYLGLAYPTQKAQVFGFPTYNEPKSNQNSAMYFLFVKLLVFYTLRL